MSDECTPMDLQGTPPVLTGKVCEGLLVREYWFNGQLEEEVNIVDVMVEGCWLTVYIDCGIVFWKQQNGSREGTPPFEAEFGNTLAYPVRVLGKELELNGKMIRDYEMKWFSEGASVEITFADGTSVKLNDVADRTSLLVERGKPSAAQIRRRKVLDRLTKREQPLVEWK